jgi:hypothetical protein
LAWFFPSKAIPKRTQKRNKLLPQTRNLFKRHPDDPPHKVFIDLVTTMRRIVFSYGLGRNPDSSN